MQLFVLKSCHTNEIEEGLQQPHNIHTIPGGFEFVATTACITVVFLYYHAKPLEHVKSAWIFSRVPLTQVPK